MESDLSEESRIDRNTTRIQKNKGKIDLASAIGGVSGSVYRENPILEKQVSQTGAAQERI